MIAMKAPRFVNAYVPRKNTTELVPSRSCGSAAATAARPMRKFPAWAMELYPSIRLMFPCARASTLPRLMERAASTANTFAQSLEMKPSPSATRKTRMTTANPAALLPTER